MYNDIDEVRYAIFDRMSEVTLNEMESDKELLKLFALQAIYRHALEEAKEYGWIGVGCITFADNRLRSYQQLPLIHDADIRGFDEYGNYGEQNHPLERG